jgi:hypothetical protein
MITLFSYFVFKPLFFLGGAVYALWMFLVLLEATLNNRSIWVGILSVFTSFSQLSLYGAGMITEGIRKRIKG